MLLKLFVERPWHDNVATLDCGYGPTFLHFPIPSGSVVDQLRLERALFHLGSLLVPRGLHHDALLVFHSCKALQVHAIDWRHAIGVSVVDHVLLIVVLPAELFYFIHLLTLSGYLVLDQVCFVESVMDRTSMIRTVLTHLLSNHNRVLADLRVVARALHVRVVGWKHSPAVTLEGPLGLVARAWRRRHLLPKEVLGHLKVDDAVLVLLY